MQTTNRSENKVLYGRKYISCTVYIYIYFFFICVCVCANKKVIIRHIWIIFYILISPAWHLILIVDTPIAVPQPWLSSWTPIQRKSLGNVPWRSVLYRIYSQQFSKYWCVDVCTSRLSNSWQFSYLSPFHRYWRDISREISCQYQLKD